MSNEKQLSIVTEALLKMQKCIDNGDRDGFLKLLENRHQISNCSVGDSHSQQYVQRVYANALEKFLS